MKYFIVTGETSGDQHAAHLMKEILLLDNDAQFQYWGGDKMRAVAYGNVQDIENIAFMGLVEVVKNLGTIRGLFKKVKQQISDYQPDKVILVDYPGFNLRLVKWLKSLGIKVYYYISPTIWAWHKSRVNLVRKYVDEMFVILPFEKEHYAREGVDVHYLGNPTLDAIHEYQPDPDFAADLRAKYPNKRFVGILPGSRKQELEKIFNIMLSAASQLKDVDSLVFLIPKAPLLHYDLYADQMKRYSSLQVEVVEDRYFDILSMVEVAMVTSGTATLETALFDVPQVVVYRMNPLTFQIAKRLVDVKYISLPNLIAQKQMVTELIQEELSEDRLLEEIEKLLSLSREDRQSFYAELNDRLGDPGVSRRVAEVIVTT